MLTTSQTGRFIRLLYEDVDEKIAQGNHKCTNCKKCCDFTISGLSLFVTNLEFEYFRLNADEIRVPQADRCPYLDEESGCSVREIRPLGCRTFFCNPSDDSSLSEIYEDALARIKSFVMQNNLPYSYKLWIEILKGR